MAPHLFVPERPALGQLIAAMTKLSARRRRDIAVHGRRAEAARDPALRHLVSKVTAEARRLRADGELS